MTTGLKWAAALILGAFLIAFGIMKFTGAHIFQHIEANATANGLPFADLFHPFVNHAVGAMEIVAGVLLIAPKTRLLGAALGLGVLGGALAFHLSSSVGVPYLGLATPTGFAEGAAAPWTAADFTPADPADYSPMLFMIAVAMTVLAALNLWLNRPRGAA